MATSERYNAIKSKLRSSSQEIAVQGDSYEEIPGRSKRYNDIRKKLLASGLRTSADENFVKNFFNDAGRYVQQMQDAYNGLSWETATSKDAIASRESAASDMLERSSKVRTFLNANKRNLDTETYKSLLGYLDEFDNFRQQASTSFRRAQEGYSQFESEDEYKTYQTQQEQLSADTTALTQELGQMRNLLTRYQDLTTREIGKADEAELAQMRKQYATAKDLEKAIKEKEAYLKGAKALQAAAAKQKNEAAWQDKYAGLSYTELMSRAAALEDGDERAWITSYAPTTMTKEDTDAEYAKVKQVYDQLSAALEQYQYGDRFLLGADGAAATERFAEEYGSVDELETRVENLRAQMYQLENASKYNFISENADFAEKSKYEGATSSRLQNLVNSPDGAGQSDVMATVGKYLEPIAGNIYGALNYENLQHMTDDERKVFNYIYNTQGEDSAKEYLDYLQATLNERSMTGMMEKVSDLTRSAPVLSHAVASFLSTPINLLGGDGLLDAAGQKAVADITGEYKPVDYNRDSMFFSRVAGTIRGTVTSDIANATGVIDFDEEEHPILSKALNGKSLGDVYQLGMSMQDSVAVVGLSMIHPALGQVGTALLGGTAGTQAMLDAVERGASDEQAITLGIVSGVAEMVFEKYELESLLGQSDEIIKSIFKQAASEAVGEGATEIANIAADFFIMADKSNWMQSVEQYMAEGKNQTQAHLLALLDANIQTTWAGIGGALIGGIMGGGMSAVQSQANKAQREAGLDALAALQVGNDLPGLIAEALELDPKNSLALKMQKQLNSGEQVSARDIRTLMEETAQKQDTKMSTDTATQLLQEYGETGDITALSAAVAKQATGGKLTRAEQRLIDQSQYGQNAVDELNARMKQLRDAPATQPAQPTQENTDTADTTVTPKETASQGSYEASADGRTIRKSTGEAVTIKGVASIKGKEMILRLEDGSEVSASDVAYGSEDEALVYEAVASIAENADVANAMLEGYRLSTGVSGKAYAKGLMDAYLYGKENYSAAEMANGTFTSLIGESHRMYAYERGARDGGNTTKTKSSATGDTVRRKGRVRGYEVSIQQLNKAFNSAQRQAYRILAAIAEVTGIDIVLYQSKPDADGNFRGGIVDGIDMNDTDGAFSWRNDTIYIDINAGLMNTIGMNDVTKYAMLRAFGHEFTHFLEKHNPVEYANFRDLVFETMRKKGADPEKMIDSYMAQGLDHDKASREVVAEAMTDILPETTFVQQLAEKHGRIFNKLLTNLKEFIRQVKEHFRLMSSDTSPEPAAVKEHINGTVRYVEEIVKMFDRIAVQGVERYQEGRTVQKNTADEGGVQHKIRASFYAEIDAWDKKDTNKTFTVGTTSEALQSVGIKNQSVVIRSGTILQKINKHSEMTIDVFKCIPELLEHPIIIQFSDAVDPQTRRPKYDSRITVLGELYAEGKPVLVSLELLPTNQKKTVVLDFAVITSAYSKGALQRYLDENSILYIEPNKKRTNSWLSLNRLQLPLGENRYGSIRKISYVDGKVKVQNAKNMTDMQRAMLAAGLIDVYGNPQSSGGQHQNRRRTATLSNREVLERAYEVVDRQKLTEGQRSAMEVFQRHLEKLRELETKKAEQQSIIDNAKKEGAPKASYIAAINRRDILTQQIYRESRKLLEIENSAVLRRILTEARQVIEAKQAEDRERALQEYRKRRDDSDKRRREGKKRTEMRHKIQKVIKDLNKLLSKGNKKRNVKQGMQGFVASAIASAEVLFMDTYSETDMVRNGVGVDLTDKESQLLNDAMDLLAQLDDLPAYTGDYDAYQEQTKTKERLERKLAGKLKELKAVFERERKRLNGATVAAVLGGLKAEYEALENAEEDYIRSAYSDNVCAYLDSVVQEIGETTIRDMTLGQMEALYKAYTMVLTAVTKANTAFVDGKAIDKTAEQMVREFSGRKMPKEKVTIVARNLSNKLGWDYEKLYYALERINSPTLTRLFNNLAASEDITMADVAEATAFRDAMVEKYGYNKWKINQQIDKVFVDNTGKEFRLTLGQLMALYAYSRREGAWKHIEVGGFVFDNVPITENNSANTYKLTREQCEAITDLLTADQKAFAEKMQSFLSDVMGAKGNEVSMDLYGIEMFGEKNYFPIHIAGQYKAAAQESTAKAQAGFASMSNAGFTQAQNKNATAPFVLDGFLEVWADHVNEMSRYHGTVRALEDIRRVMNYSTYISGSTDSIAVKAVMENRFGKKAVAYFDALYREANSGAVTDRMQALSSKLLSKFRKNSVAYSMSVLIQQPASLGRAYAMIDKKYFGFRGFGTLPVGIAKAVTNKWTKAHSNAYEEMLKYAPGVTITKEIGGFDTATGSSIRGYLLDTQKSFISSMKTETLAGKAKAVSDLIDNNPVANLPNVADKIAWIEIWNACKRETASKNPSMWPGSEEFLKVVGERFTEVIRATQVYDSIFAKSPMLKSKNLAVQYLVSFMNEPNVVANMAESAVRDATKGDWKSATKKVTAVARSVVLTCILKSIPYAMRDDDEDETFVEKYIQALTSSLINDITVFNYIPVLRDVWSVAQGYDVERPDMSVIADAAASVTRVITLWTDDASAMTEKELEEYDKKLTAAYWKLLESVMGGFGIPVKNIRREIDAVINCAGTVYRNFGKSSWESVKDTIEQGIADASPVFARDTKSKADKLYSAISSGDTSYIERLKKTYVDDEGKFNESSYTTAVRKGLRENDPRIRQAAKAKLNKDFNEYRRLILEIVNEGHFKRKDVVAAIDTEFTALKKKQKTS